VSNQFQATRFYFSLSTFHFSLQREPVLNFGRKNQLDQPKPVKARGTLAVQAHAKKPVVRPRELPQELLRRLEFTVVRKLDGFFFGDYTGLFYGPSLDLAEVREYQPGDEVRRMDWNVTARTGKLHVRQYREEREITAWVVVDLSRSMNFGTRKKLKRDLALEFAGVAAGIVTRHGDKIGTVGVNEAGLKMVRPASGRNQALNVLQTLTNLPSTSTPTGARSVPNQIEVNPKTPAGETSLVDALSSLEKLLRRRALVFVISDFIDGTTPASTVQPVSKPNQNPVISRLQGNDPAWAEPLGRLASRHDVIAVRVSDPAERELPNVGGLRLRDPESGREVWVDTSDARVRAAHANLVKTRDTAINRAFRGARIDALELSTKDELLEPLLKFTLRRKGRR
jgi:uncharacterized protein (DUF58 family)